MATDTRRPTGIKGEEEAARFLSRCGYAILDNKLGKLAQSYLKLKRLREQPCRFDVVAVVVNDDGGVKAIRHIPNAFSVAAW